jgi:hypothetical protein
MSVYFHNNPARKRFFVHMLTPNDGGQESLSRYEKRYHLPFVESNRK